MSKSVKRRLAIQRVLADGHTPPHWEVADEVARGSERTVTVYALGEPPGNRLVVYLAEGKTHAQRVANGNLIALAPTAPHECSVPGCTGPENKRKLEAFDELLAACKAALPLHNTAQWTEMDVLCDTIRAAIAKAEGQ